jgi:hypothetical protein
VGTTVDSDAVHVDLASASVAVHVGDTYLRTATGLSSTAARFLGTNVSGDSGPSSPASTAAKTTDENLNSRRDNDKNDLAVDRVDGGVLPPTERECSVRSECRRADNDRDTIGAKGARS